MTVETPQTHYLSHSDLEMLSETHIKHPYNPASDVYLRRLSPLVGLKRLGLYLARIPAGGESFLYHRHERDEEFLFILSGRGQAEIGEESFEVGPGDFMGFPAPDGPAHHLVNPFDEDLVYLMGDESSGLDIGHFPRIGRRLVFSSSGIWDLSDDDIGQMTFEECFAD